MTQALRIVLITLAATFVVSAAVAFVYLFSGSYDVAATTRHTGFGEWVLGTLKKRSIRQHAAALDINVPPVAGEQLQHGIEHFVAMCVPCHGAPGVERGEYGKGMTPTPPDLADAAREWEPAELFWIVKHGVKLAGMPAFGRTHTDEELWGIVSFLQQLPNISPEEYERVAASVAGSSHSQTAPDAVDGAAPAGADTAESAHDHAGTTHQN